MTLCYFSRLCGQRFREPVNGKMGKREKWGRKRGRHKDGETGEEVRQELYKAAASFMFICAVVSDADCVASALLKSDMNNSKKLFIK